MSLIYCLLYDACFTQFGCYGEPYGRVGRGFLFDELKIFGTREKTIQDLFACFKNKGVILMKKILEEDLVLLNARIESTLERLFALGEDFNEAVNQSSETWHDNAPFDVARDKQTLLNVELGHLRAVRRESQKVTYRPSNRVTVGSKVELSGPRTLKLLLGGSWVGREAEDGYQVISCESPVGKLLLGRKVDDIVELPEGKSVVRALL